MTLKYSYVHLLEMTLKCEVTTFFIECDDLARLWVDSEMVVNSWHLQAGQHIGKISLTKDKVVSLRLEYMERAGNASISLQWESLSLSKEVRG